MGYNIRFTRPETRATVSRLYIPSDDQAQIQIRRLQSLGYTIVEIDPPIRGHDGDDVRGLSSSNLD